MKISHVPMLPESLRAAREALGIECRELLDYPRELPDAAHEHADGHESTIYTYRAHKLCLDGCTSSELAEAEEEAEDCCALEGKGYHESASILAYFILRRRFEETVREALTDYRTALEDWESEDSDESTAGAIESELDALRTILGI